VKKYTFKASEAESSFKHPIYYARDELTGEKIPGKQGSFYFKLFQRGMGVMADKTMFYGRDGNVIDKNDLMGVSIRFIPLIAIKSIFIGAVMCLQMELVSAIVTNITERNSISPQLATIERLRKQSPDDVDKVTNQIAKIRMLRQNRGTPDLVTDQQQEEEDPSNTSTLSGIQPTPLSSLNAGSPVYVPPQQQPAGAASDLLGVIGTAPKRQFKLPPLNG